MGSCQIVPASKQNNRTLKVRAKSTGLSVAKSRFVFNLTNKNTILLEESI